MTDTGRIEIRGARLLVTNLFNRVQPLIRFQLSDVVTLDPEPCPCGRPLRRLRERLARRLAELGVRDPAPEVEACAAIERPPAGKLQMVIADGRG